MQLQESREMAGMGSFVDFLAGSGQVLPEPGAWAAQGLFSRREADTVDWHVLSFSLVGEL